MKIRCGLPRCNQWMDEFRWDSHKKWHPEYVMIELGARIPEDLLTVRVKNASNSRLSKVQERN